MNTGSKTIAVHVDSSPQNLPCAELAAYSTLCLQARYSDLVIVIQNNPNDLVNGRPQMGPSMSFRIRSIRF